MSRKPHPSGCKCLRCIDRAVLLRRIDAARAARRAETDHRIHEFEHLIDGGVWPPQAAARAGWSTTNSALKALERSGRRDLASRLNRAQEVAA